MNVYTVWALAGSGIEWRWPIAATSSLAAMMIGRAHLEAMGETITAITGEALSVSREIAGLS
jgi:hypothetical protein